MTKQTVKLRKEAMQLAIAMHQGQDVTPEQVFNSARKIEWYLQGFWPQNATASPRPDDPFKESRENVTRLNSKL